MQFLTKHCSLGKATEAKLIVIPLRGGPWSQCIEWVFLLCPTLASWVFLLPGQKIWNHTMERCSRKELIGINGTGGFFFFRSRWAHLVTNMLHIPLAVKKSWAFVGAGICMVAEWFMPGGPIMTADVVRMASPAVRQQNYEPEPELFQSDAETPLRPQKYD